jgi:hypothetical protein
MIYFQTHNVRYMLTLILLVNISASVEGRAREKFKVEPAASTYKVISYTNRLPRRSRDGIITSSAKKLVSNTRLATSVLGKELAIGEYPGVGRVVGIALPTVILGAREKLPWANEVVDLEEELGVKAEPGRALELATYFSREDLLAEIAELMLIREFRSCLIGFLTSKVYDSNGCARAAAESTAQTQFIALVLFIVSFAFLVGFIISSKRRRDQIAHKRKYGLPH